MSVIWVLIVIGQVHGGASVATHNFSDQKTCQSIAKNLLQWPEVKATKCFERWS